MEGSLQDLYGRLEQIKYINHLGEELNFGRDGLYVNENDLHDFTWTLVSVNDRISGFERNTQTRTVPVRVACASITEGVMRRNKLFQIPEKDVLAKQYGKLIVNGYYCECFVTASKKERYSKTEKYMQAELTITTDRPYWVKETKVLFDVDSSWQPPATGGVDFPFDLPFDLLPFVRRSIPIMNESFFDTAFKMVVHGYSESPVVTINDHDYEVDVNVPQGRILTIDSVSKTIYLSDADGDNVENAFDKRNRDSYIFQPIPAGELTIRWDNTFDIDLYLLEQLSEPKWILGGLNEHYN